PPPVVPLAPLPPVTVTFPAEAGIPWGYGGARTLSVPPPPAGYTIVSFYPSVAYVPATGGALAPKRPPPGFAAVTHPRAGRIFVPAGYAVGGAPAPGTPFGKTATGYPEPAVAVATPVYSFPRGLASVVGAEPPAGYTVVSYAGQLAYVPAVAG